MKYLRRVVRGVASVGLAALVLSLTGCQNFFICDKASCTTSGGNTAAGNVAYSSNSASGSTFINGYTLASNTLTAATNSPYSSNPPTAMVVSRNNMFLYVASAATTTTQAAIYGYSIGTGGALTALSNGVALAGLTSIGAMDVSPDGNWLVVASANDNINPTTITPFQLNTTAGTITAGTPLIYSGGTTSTVSALKVAPSGQFISVALGTAGIMTFPFVTSTGAIGQGTPITFNSSAVGAYDLAIDSNNFLYVAASSAIYVFSVSTAGIPATPQVAMAATASGGPFSIALDGTSYLYAGALNGTTNLIYAFSIGKTGTLTPLSTATISSPTTTTKLAVDSTGAFLLALGYDSSAGLKMYGIGSTTGVLTSLDSTGTGTSPSTVPAALALTH